MIAFTGERYTMQDARNRRELADYVLSMVRHAHATLIQLESAYLSHAWNNLHWELRGGILKPTDSTTIDEFIQ